MVQGQFTLTLYVIFVDSYPTLDFENQARKPYYGEQAIEDQYGNFIEKLWIQLEVEKENCACPACTKKYCKIDCTDCTEKINFHYHHNYWQKKCEKITRQRLKKRSYRTCRFCQKNIPKDEFEKLKYSYDDNTFTRLHMDPCAKKHGFIT